MSLHPKCLALNVIPNQPYQHHGVIQYSKSSDARTSTRCSDAADIRISPRAKVGNQEASAIGAGVPVIGVDTCARVAAKAARLSLCQVQCRISRCYRRRILRSCQGWIFRCYHDRFGRSIRHSGSDGNQLCDNVEGFHGGR